MTDMPPSSAKPVYVTRPHLPPLEAFLPYLEAIWQNRILTNGGPFHHEFEEGLRRYLGVGEVALCNNGTTALLIALRSMNLSGEVITTPYSFVATSHALLWSGLEPVFVDIDPNTLNLDPARIEAAITPRTRAILAVHCYGHPCDVAAIQAIADRHGLKVIYDAAHAFGVQDAGGSVLRHGDLSVLSFHATKVFNTFEGGAIVCRDAATKQGIHSLKNFGFQDEVTVETLGTNGKMSEFNAALGLLQLQYFEAVIARRKEIDSLYRALLRDVPGIRCPAIDQVPAYNYAYFPIFVEADYPISRDALYERLKRHDIHARRYFYPLISEMPMYSGRPSARAANLPVASRIAGQVLCLPIYPDLDLGVVAEIAAHIADV